MYSNILDHEWIESFRGLFEYSYYQNSNIHLDFEYFHKASNFANTECVY